jgi:Tfp pilus assembly protein PilO
MTTINKKGVRAQKKKSSFAEFGKKMMAWAIALGTPKVFVLFSLLALGIGAGLYYQYITPMAASNDSLKEQLAQKRKQNAIARMVQETKPRFLDEFRRVINNYTTARELLPSETEVSNVMDAIQQMARANNVRVTMFDASKPGAKSTNPVANGAAPQQQEPNAAAQPALPQSPAPPQVALNERVMPAQIQGTHANVARFLRDVAKYPRIIYVRDFSITSLNRQESVNLTLVTYDAPTSGILPPIPAELREEFRLQGSQTASLITK